MSRVSRMRMSLLVSRNGLPYSPIADFTDLTSYMNIFCTPVQCAIDSSFKVNNHNMPYLVCWSSTSSGQRNTQLGNQLNHHPLQQHYVAMTRLLDREVCLQESCLHVGMQVRQSHHITEVNWYPSYIVVMVISETTVYKLRQWLGIRREVARPDWSCKPMHDNEP